MSKQSNSLPLVNSQRPEQQFLVSHELDFGAGAPIVPVRANEALVPLYNHRVTSFEVVPFGSGSPYEEEFPTLNSLPYEQKAAVTQQIAKIVLDIAQRESGGPILQNAFGPGGWMTYVNPAVVTTIEGSAEGAERFANITGYLLQQSEVWVNRPLKSGNRGAFQIVETSGETLKDSAAVLDFWKNIRDEVADNKRLSAKVMGFQPVRVNGNPGIRVLTGKGRFNEKQAAELHKITARAAQRARIHVDTSAFNAEVKIAKHDWATDKTGRGYLERLRKIGRPSLQRRLVGEYAPAVREAIRRAVEEHTPEAAPTQTSVVTRL